MKMKEMAVIPRTIVTAKRVKIPKMRIYKNIALTVNLQIIFVNESLLKLICSNLQIIKNKTMICTEKEDSKDEDLQEYSPDGKFTDYLCQ